MSDKSQAAESKVSVSQRDQNTPEDVDPYAPKGSKLSQWLWFAGLSLGGLLFVLIIAKLLHVLMFIQID